MSQFDTPDRSHTVSSSTDSAGIEISGSVPQYTWRVDLMAKRQERFVEIRVLDRLVVELTPQEARAFARVLLEVASD